MSDYCCRGNVNVVLFCLHGLDGNDVLFAPRVGTTGVQARCIRQHRTCYRDVAVEVLFHASLVCAWSTAS